MFPASLLVMEHKVTGIDIAASLIEIARAKDPAGSIVYQVADLSQPLPAYQSHFDLIASHLVLNDVYDYQGFLTTLGAVAKPGGHLVLSLNTPYSYVVRGHITNYFESGKAFPYRGMAEAGVKVHFYQRTLMVGFTALALDVGFRHPWFTNRFC